jgi:hypothetical protein
MSLVKWLVVALLACMLVVSSAALAGRGDPQEKIVPADQARAKAMLLRSADFSPVFTATPPSDVAKDVYCEALDESDLTITGEAESPSFQGGVELGSSLAQVYESRADSSASWRRGTSAAGEKCAQDSFRKRFQKNGVSLESFRRLAFPRFAERSIAYRLTASSQGVRVYFDVVVLKQSRAQAALLLGSGLAPMPKAEELRLTRSVAGRMAKAMRGSS